MDHEALEIGFLVVLNYLCEFRFLTLN
jgi:hypothetical protein